jgi:hypothetical protein
MIEKPRDGKEWPYSLSGPGHKHFGVLPLRQANIDAHIDCLKINYAAHDAMTPRKEN